MQKFHGVQWLSSTDMSNSFWQVKLHPNSKKYTTFMFDNKTYWFNVVVFGLNIKNNCNFQLSKTRKPIAEIHLKGFLGLTGYLRKFCRDLLTLEAPLLELLR
ncbi:hypothetical protein B566_EDAN013505, partial [Ephemera danica]